MHTTGTLMSRRRSRLDFSTGNGGYLIKLYKACIEHLLCTDYGFLEARRKYVRKVPGSSTHHVTPGCLLSRLSFVGVGSHLVKEGEPG